MVSNDNNQTPKPQAEPSQLSSSGAGRQQESWWPNDVWKWIQTQLWLFTSDRGDRMYKPYHHLNLVGDQLHKRVRDGWEQFALPSDRKWRAFCPITKEWLQLNASGQWQCAGSIEEPVSRKEGW